MALTEDQIQECLLVLNLPVRTDVTFVFQDGDRHGGQALRNSEIVRKALEQANATQEAKIVTMLDRWDGGELAYDADRIKAEGLDSDPSRTRALFANRLQNLLGYALPPNNGGMSLSRS